MVLTPTLLTVLFCAAWMDAPDNHQPLLQSPKIRFDLSQLNSDGLLGPADGLRALNYELCIPGTDDAANTLRAIDPSIQIHRGSRGRIGCAANEYLSIGSTHQSDFRQVLDNLAELEFVERIEASYGE